MWVMASILKFLQFATYLIILKAFYKKQIRILI